MHELSLCQALIEQVEDVLAREGATRATTVTVEVGGLSGVEPLALETAFEVAREGTGLADARLEMKLVPASIHCRACGRDAQPEPPVLVCPHCGALDYVVMAGRDFLLRSVEVQ